VDGNIIGDGGTPREMVGGVGGGRHGSKRTKGRGAVESERCYLRIKMFHMKSAIGFLTKKRE